MDRIQLGTKERKNDLILVGILLAAALIFFVISRIFLHPAGQTDRLTVRVKVDGKVTCYPLSQEKQVRISDEKGRNVIEIGEGRVLMKEADCPDQICVRHRPISSPEDDPIICLPHKIIVDIVTADQVESDQ